MLRSLTRAAYSRPSLSLSNNCKLIHNLNYNLHYNPNYKLNLRPYTKTPGPTKSSSNISDIDFTISDLKHIYTTLSVTDKNNSRRFVPDCYANTDPLIENKYPLLYYTSTGNVDIVKFLLNRGADSRRDHLLSTASAYGDLPMVKLLVSNNVDIVEFNNAPIKRAIKYNHLEVANFLLNNGADVNVDNSYLLLDAIHNKNLPMVKLLVGHGINYNVYDNLPLKTAVMHKCGDIVLFLHKIIFSVNIYDNLFECVYPLCVSEMRSLPFIKEFINNGSDIHADNDYMLISAVRHGCIDTVKFLLESGANVHACDESALFCAIDQNDLPMVKLLVESGADIRYSDNKPIKFAYPGPVCAYLESVLHTQ